AAEQRVLVVRRVAADHDCVDVERAESEDQEDADVDVGDPVGDVVPEADRDHGPGQERSPNRDAGREYVEDAIGLGRDEALFEGELDTVGGKLQQAVGTDTVWPGAALDSAKGDALEPHRVSGGGEHNEEKCGDRDGDDHPVPDRVVVEVVHGWAGPMSTGAGSRSANGGCASAASAGNAAAASR